MSRDVLVEGSSSLNLKLPWRLLTHGAGELGEPVLWGWTASRIPGSKRPKQGCWSKEDAEGTPPHSLDQGPWMWPPQSHSKPASPCKPQEGDKVPSCAVVALDKPKGVPGWQRTAISFGGQPEALGKSLMKSWMGKSAGWKWDAGAEELGTFYST